MIHPNEILGNVRATAAWINQMDADEAAGLADEADGAASAAPNDGIGKPLFVALREVCRTRADAAAASSRSEGPTIVMP